MDKGSEEKTPGVLGGAQAAGETPGSGLQVRAAQPEDAEAIAAILAEAFPGLYRATFGRLGTEEVAWLLTELYRAGMLSLEMTRVCTRGNRVVGIAILHVGQSIGRGTASAYWRLLLLQLGLLRAPRAFFGGLSANAYLSRRIPHAGDLVYVEALAVAAPERRRGAGTRLLEDAAAWARERDRSRLALHVLRSNTGARRLYERWGFHPWPGKRPLGTSGSALLMVCHLKDAISA